VAEAKLRPIEELTPAEAREQVEATARARKAEPLPVARVEERMIPGPAEEIRLRLYFPQAAPPVPAIVYYHGGGHVIGSLDTHDFVARNLCSGVGALVASVDYAWLPSTNSRRPWTIPGLPSNGSARMPKASAPIPAAS